MANPTFACFSNSFKSIVLSAEPELLGWLIEPVILWEPWCSNWAKWFFTMSMLVVLLSKLWVPCSKCISSSSWLLKMSVHPVFVQKCKLHESLSRRFFDEKILVCCIEVLSGTKTISPDLMLSCCSQHFFPFSHWKYCQKVRAFIKWNRVVGVDVSNLWLWHLGGWFVNFSYWDLEKF